MRGKGSGAVPNMDRTRNSTLGRYMLYVYLSRPILLLSTHLACGRSRGLSCSRRATVAESSWL